MFCPRRLHLGQNKKSLGYADLTFLDTVVGTVHTGGATKYRDGARINTVIVHLNATVDSAQTVVDSLDNPHYHAFIISPKWSLLVSLLKRSTSGI